jgi:hypothetical protein
MNLFNKDLGLDLLINRKKVGSDSGSVISYENSNEEGSLLDAADRSDMGSVRSVTINPTAEPQQSSPFNVNINEGVYDDYNDDETDISTMETPQQNFPFNRPNATTANTPFNMPQQYPAPPRMSEEEILNTKREILYQFERMERKGTQLPKRFTLASSLDEMRSELDRLKRDREIDQSIKFQRKVMMTLVTGTELLNNRFDPVGARLEGWSESVNDGIDDYDDIFEELHNKYKGKSNIPPEIKLLFMLGGSAFMFHMTNTMFKTYMPGAEQVFKNNPDLMRQFAAATASTMQQNAAQSDPLMSGVSGMFANMFGQSAGGNAPQGPSTPQGPPQSAAQRGSATARVNMKGPTNVDDILRELEKETMDDRVEIMSTITQSEYSELADDASINGLLVGGGGSRKNGSGKKGITLNI